LPVLIDEEASANYRRCLKRLTKTYRRAETDIASAFEEIIKDFRRACHATPVPGYNSTVWKYRCASSDMSKGRSGGFRMLCYYSEELNTLYPFYAYTHTEFENQPPPKDIRNCLKELLHTRERGHGE
jgi:mRNA-degrading endonuclease RelE of RelBE toxin-antitoxin system